MVWREGTTWAILPLKLEDRNWLVRRSYFASRMKSSSSRDREGANSFLALFDKRPLKEMARAREAKTSDR